MMIAAKTKKATGREWRKWRISKLLSMSQMAMILGMSKRSIVYIEQGKVMPNYEHRAAFAELVDRHKREKENRNAGKGIAPSAG